MQVFKVKPVLDGFNLAHGIGESDAGPEPRHHAGIVTIVIMQPLRFCPVSRFIWNPELHLRVGISEGSRQHANNGVWLAIKMNLLADDRGVARESPLKKTPGEHHRTAAWPVFRLGEGAPVSRLNAQHRKQIRGSASR